MSHCVFKPGQLQRLTEDWQESGTTGGCDDECCDASVTTSTSPSLWQELATTGSCDSECCDASVTTSTSLSRWEELATAECCVTICAVMQTSQSLHHSPDPWVSRCTPVTCHRVTRYTLQSVTGSPLHPHPPPPPFPPSPPPG